MAKFTLKNIEFKDWQKAIFGDSDDSNIHWNPDNAELTITTVVSGVDPTDPGHLVTRRYLEDELATVSGGIIQVHGNLSGLGADDHTQYILVNGSRAFTSTVGGVTPTSDEHLTTKQYVDDEITTLSGSIVLDHGDLTGLDDDDHSQYLRTDGSRELSDNWYYGSANISGSGSFYGNGATLSGVAYVDGDDVYFYDTTRSKDLGVAILQIGCGRNSANTTNQYLRTFNGTPMNQTGVALPWDATLIGGAAMGSRNDQTWTIRLRKNGSATNLASLTVTNAYENHIMTADIDFDEGDRVQIYMEGTNINYPQARLYFRRRK